MIPVEHEWPCWQYTDTERMWKRQINADDLLGLDECYNMLQFSLDSFRLEPKQWLCHDVYSAQGAVFRETQIFMKTWTGFGQTTDEDFVQGNKQRHWSWDYVIFIFIHLIHCNIYHSNVRTNQLKRTARNGPWLTQVPSVMYVPLERILVRTQNSRPHDPHSWWGAQRRAFPARFNGPETVKLENRKS